MKKMLIMRILTEKKKKDVLGIRNLNKKLGWSVYLVAFGNTSLIFLFLEGNEKKKKDINRGFSVHINILNLKLFWLFIKVFLRCYRRVWFDMMVGFELFTALSLYAWNKCQLSWKQNMLRILWYEVFKSIFMKSAIKLHSFFIVSLLIKCDNLQSVIAIVSYEYITVTITKNR